VNRDSAAARARRRQAAIAAKGGPHVGPRICLSCDHSFLSEGPWNRICPRCGERNVSLPPRATSAHSGFTAGDLHRLLGD
jgi:hypothetical protein